MRFLSEKKREKDGKISSELGQNKGQVTIFIIIAIVVVAAVLLYFFLSGAIAETRVPVTLEPVYNNFLECIKQDTETGISILESQAGYIELPAFEPGSQYMPFSSQLNFLGNPVPYWYYVSGNNIEREQVPTKTEMENQLENYIAENINDCNFQTYHDEGFEITLEAPGAKVKIKDNVVETTLNADLTITKGDESVSVRNHRTSVNSNLGSLYNSAKEVYDYEQDNLFLEEYAVDTLRLYAPVDKTEITCSPLIWSADEVFNNLQEAIEENTRAIKTTGSTDDYFKIDVPIEEEVRFINSRSWPNGFEVSPAEGNLLVAEPVGSQQGLGILGFCYVPYHFVYDVKYPVLVQVQRGDEIFQFPMAVVIQGNNPREPLNGTAAQGLVPEICEFKNTEVKISAEDASGNPIEADISYECLENTCAMGKTSSNGLLSANFPQCVNGFVVARAQGFKETRAGPLSTVSSSSFEVIMERLYPKTVQLKVDGANYNDNAIIYFVSEDFAQTVAYPQQKIVQLAQGQYEIQVYTFRNSSINIGATTAEQCIEVTRPGFLGVLGFKEERCFDINIPAQVVSQALAGGGKQNYFILESELAGTNVIEINAESLPVPDTIEKLQNNYLLFEDKRLDISFR